MNEDEKVAIRAALLMQGTQPLSRELEEWIALSEGAPAGSTLQAGSFKVLQGTSCVIYNGRAESSVCVDNYEQQKKENI